MIRFLSDLRYRRRHKREATDRPRLASLSDSYPLTYGGYRSWCDGRLKHCRLCGDRCCDCYHTEVPPEGCPKHDKEKP